MNIIDKVIGYVEECLGLKNSNYNEIAKNNEDEDISIFTAGRFEKGLNGRIDEPVYQGKYGDCWLMTGILSMSYSKNGANEINNSMSIYKDGSVNVKFKGINKAYNVSKYELDANNKNANSASSNYSTGDDDMLAIELAIEKITKDKNIATNYSLQNGGNPYYIYKLYDADTIEAPRTKVKLKQALDKRMLFPNKCAMAFGIVNQDVVMGCLKKGHSYAVKNIDSKSVTVIDPWDSTREIKLNKEQFLNNYDKITMMYAEFR